MKDLPFGIIRCGVQALEVDMILVLLGHDENVFMSRVHVTSALLHSRSRGESVIYDQGG